MSPPAVPEANCSAIWLFQAKKKGPCRNDMGLFVESLFAYATLLRGSHNETVTPILRPASLGLFFTDGNFFAVADRRHAIGGDT